MIKNDSIILAAIEDKERISRERDIMTFTGFLDARNCAIASKSFEHSKHILYGGYEDAERRIMVFLPDYLDDIPEDENPLAVLRVKTPKGSKELTHRDHLGSLLSLGVDRSVTGDIIVKPNEADIVILKSMGDFFLNNYARAGHTVLTTELLPIDQLSLGEIHVTEKRDTVASLRIDNMIGSAFNLSRTKAQEAIQTGLVFINGIQCEKTHLTVEEGDRFVLRGKGKAVLKEIGKTTKKDRISVIIEIY